MTKLEHLIYAQLVAANYTRPQYAKFKAIALQAAEAYGEGQEEKSPIREREPKGHKVK